MDNRTVILNNALALFAKQGYESVGVQTIAAAAGITKPTLYYYFGNKQGVLAALLKEYSMPLHNTIHAAATYHGDLSVTLHQLAHSWFQYAQLHQEFYRMQLAMYFAPYESLSNRMVREINETLYQEVETVFILAAEHHGNMRGRHMALAATFIGLINTYIGLSVNGYVALDQTITTQAVHQFMYGIYA